MLEITKPTLVINEAIARRNIQRMAAKANRNNLEFIPHFKTHQSIEVGEWFKEEGVTKITVSSVSMAQYFSQAGWHDITIAFPVNLLEKELISDLLNDVALTLLVTDIETVKKLEDLSKPASLYIEIDAGYHRSGVLFENLEYLQSLIDTIHSIQHSFKGFYYHSGNSYSLRGKQEVEQLFKESSSRLQLLKNKFSEYAPHIAFGDTPTCSVIDHFKGIDSIHPGNFVYYDVTQVEIGSCSFDDIAVVVQCPVVMKSAERNELVIYGGGVHLSKEQLIVKEKPIYGLVALPDEEGRLKPIPEAYVKSLSQEHGIISVTEEYLATVEVGDVLSVFPIHSCMAVDCMTGGFTEKGKPITQMKK